MDNIPIQMPDGRHLPAEVVVNILRFLDCKQLRALWRTTSADNLPRFRAFVKGVLRDKGCPLHSSPVALHRDHTTKRKRSPTPPAGDAPPPAAPSAKRQLAFGGAKKKKK